MRPILPLFTVVCMVVAASVLPVPAAAQTVSPESAELRAASYDGEWSGSIKCLYDPGLWPEDECDIGLVFKIKGSVIQVQQIIRSKKGEETKSDINPGQFLLLKLATNAVAISLGTGKDEDGTWVETWSFAMTLKDPNHMIIHWSRIVNNLDMPVGKKASKFSSVGMGELTRTGMDV